jgi:hypothetical protein
METDAAREGRDHLGVEAGARVAGESCSGGGLEGSGGPDLRDAESRYGVLWERSGGEVVL